MAEQPIVWLDFRERCQHYKGFKEDDDEDQCTHPEMRSCGSTWCEQRECPRADADGVDSHGEVPKNG